MIPPFPARPINGGPLDRARTKPFPERWAYEPKVNGWRAVIHTPTGSMFNRKGEPMSIADEFSTALESLRTLCMDIKASEAHGFAPEWLDCEAFERRHALGRGSLVLFDYIPKPTDKTSWQDRQFLLTDFIHPCGVIRPGFARWQFGSTPPPEDSVLVFQSPCSAAEVGFMWLTLRALNKKWNAEVFEGVVAKRTDVPYPHATSPTHETPHWIKHRWEF